MSRFWRLTVALALLACAVTAQLNSYFRPTKVTTQCCMSVSRAKIPFEITAFSRQNAWGPCVEAIVFHTRNGKVCSNPTARWVQDRLKELQEIQRN